MKQMDMQQKQLEIQDRLQEMQMEAAFKRQEHAMKMAEMQRKGELALLLHQVKVQQLRAQAVAAAAKPTGVTSQ
jgi:hypothetical protein